MPEGLPDFQEASMPMNVVVTASRSLQRQPSHALNGEIPEELAGRNPERPGDPQQDRKARHFCAAFEIARVRRRDACGFGELFLSPAGGYAELAQALAEDLCFDCHALSFNDR